MPEAYGSFVAKARSFQEITNTAGKVLLEQKAGKTKGGGQIY